VAQEPDQPLDVLGSGCQEELLSHELQPTQTESTKADVALQFREERFDLFPLSLCVCELWCCPEISRTLPSCFVHVDGKIPERSARALGSLLAGTALLTRPDIAESAVPLVASAVVQLLACGADVAVAIR